MNNKKSYSEKLKDPRWQKKRLEIQEAAFWKCSVCGSETKELHVHHRLYLRNTEPWEYEDWAYQVVCVECHKKVQFEMELVHGLLAADHRLMTGLASAAEKFTNTNDLDCFCFIVDLIATAEPSSLEPIAKMIHSAWVLCGNAFERGRKFELDEMSK